MLIMHQDANSKRQPELTPEKGDAAKPASTFTESGAKAGQESSQYPNNYMDLMPSHQQTTEKTTAMTDEHLLKSANSQMNSCLNITPNNKYPSHNNTGSGYAYKQYSNEDYVQHKHKTEQKASQDLIDGVYNQYPPEYVNCKVTDNPSQDLAEKTEDADAQSSSQVRKKRAIKQVLKQTAKIKKIETVSPKNECESLDQSVQSRQTRQRAQNIAKKRDHTANSSITNSSHGVNQAQVACNL